MNIPLRRSSTRVRERPIRRLGWARPRLLVSVLVVLLSSGCATIPDEPVQRALYSDLRQIVETRESTGWFIDRVEYEEATEGTLQSVCRVAPEQRVALLQWLDQRIIDAGGPAEDAYEQNGDLGAVSEALTYERIRGLLAYTHQRAEDECPFWVEVDADFDGIQSDTNRFVFLAESIGGFAVLFPRGSSAKVGGGGGGRLQPGWGVTDKVTIAFPGIEVGGLGSFGGGDNDIEASIYGGVPFYIRIHDEEWIYDIEATALMRWNDNTLSWPPGFRIGFGLGLKTVRIAGLMPIGLAWAGYEYYPEFRELPETHMIRFGTRVGASWDP